MFQRIKGWFVNNRAPTTLGFVLLSACISTAVDRGFKFYDDGQDNRDKKVAIFIQSANSIDALIGFYVEAIAQNNSSPRDAKDKLYANLNDQIHKAQDMERVIEKKEKAETEIYISELDSLISILQNPESENVLTMKEFWKSVSNIVVLRNKLSDQLQS